MRFFAEIAFDGSAYHGWQIQPNAISVQEVVERVFSTYFREIIKVTAAGRTDTGVHAKQLFLHFDHTSEIDCEDTVFKLNSFLPKDISVKKIFQVQENAHARFDAVEREYQYHIIRSKNPFKTQFAYQISHQLDLDIMNWAANNLTRYKDFQCFSRSKTDVKTYHCDIKHAQWTKDGDELIFTIRADRFLRNMVRAIVGTLLEIGSGKLMLEDLEKIIESKDRSNAGASAPAHGLFLTRVIYPESIKK